MAPSKILRVHRLLSLVIICNTLLLMYGYAQTTYLRIRESDGQVIPDFKWLNQKEGPRPKYVWENREDVIYHERYYSDSAKMTAPEIFPVMRGIWVFNRLMKWVRTPAGNILAFSEGGDLQLTGRKQVSAWYSDPANKIWNDSGSTVFEKLNTRRRRDCAVLPSFQFHLSQHPVLKIAVEESTDQWQFVVSLKGRSGAPLISSDWQSGPREMTFDIRQALKKKGYDLNYAELHFVIGTWGKTAESNSRIKFSAKLINQPAIVGCLPVIRTVNTSQDGIPICAIITGTNDNDLSVIANVNGQRYSLHKQGALWQGTIKGLAAGSYKIRFEANNPEIASSVVLLRITDGAFWKHNKQYNSLQKNNVSIAPLTGSFQGTFYFKDAGLASEQLINSQKEWDDWDRMEEPGEHQHFWESLSRSELNQRFSYLSQNGWDVVHLHSHYGIWERFDASGNLAPHGIEQFATYVDEASKVQLSVQVTLSSYPYGFTDNTHWKDGTNPYMQTMEKGFKNEDWFNPQSEPFRSIYHQYIKDFVTTFKDETNIVSFSSSGEGDAEYINGIKRFQDTRETIKSIDTNHIIVSEPIHNFPNLTQLPATMVKGYNSDIVGVRNYFQGDMFVPEVEMNICLRLMQTIPNTYIAEGCFPSSNLYTRFATNVDSWLGTDYYRYNVRDWIYLGFVNRMPLIVTWDEAFTEDEHRVLSEVRKLVTWNQPLEQPVVSILLNEKDFPETRFKLGKFEQVFSRLAVDYRFISDKHQAGKQDWIIDPAKDFDSIKFSKANNLPENVRQKIPFTLSADYATKYLSSADRKMLVAYIFNKTNYEKHRFYLTGINHRMPKQGLFKLMFNNILPGYHYRLYDLDTKQIVDQGKTTKKLEIKINDTKADYFLVIYQ